MEIKGLSDDNILKISHIKEEDEWALKYRIDSYHNFVVFFLLHLHFYQSMFLS